jgi:hypothetical protein
MISDGKFKIVRVWGSVAQLVRILTGLLYLLGENSLILRRGGESMVGEGKLCIASDIIFGMHASNPPRLGYLKIFPDS